MLRDLFLDISIIIFGFLLALVSTSILPDVGAVLFLAINPVVLCLIRASRTRPMPEYASSIERSSYSIFVVVALILLMLIEAILGTLLSNKGARPNDVLVGIIAACFTITIYLMLMSSAHVVWHGVRIRGPKNLLLFPKCKLPELDLLRPWMDKARQRGNNLPFPDVRGVRHGVARPRQ